MKINTNTPERYQHIDGRSILGITTLSLPIMEYTHIIHYGDRRTDYWTPKDMFIEEIPQERWQGISFNDKGLLNDYDNKVYGSLDSLRQGAILAPYTHAIDLDDLQIVKL